MGRRPPRTSYGYLAPPEAQVRGWHCANSPCGFHDDVVPRSWPYPCPHCGEPTDATFEEPWAHEALAVRIRRDLTDPDEYVRGRAENEWCIWTYKDALLRGDRTGADRAWQQYRRSRPAKLSRADPWQIGSYLMGEMVRLASIGGEIGRASLEVLDCYPFVDTDDVEEDNTQRTVARRFVSMCIDVLVCDPLQEHLLSARVDAAMLDVAGQAEEVLMDHHHRGFRRLGELRARARSRAVLARIRRSTASAFDGLPPLSKAAERGQAAITDVDRPRIPLRELEPVLEMADAVVGIAETHDDVGPLTDLIDRLDRTGDHPGLTDLLRARLRIVEDDLSGAADALGRGEHARGPVAHRLRPHILATRGMLLARTEPHRLDEAIALCRAGRRSALNGGRHQVTPADTSLARLLLWRARAEPDKHEDDVAEATDLIRRRCQRGHGPDDLMVQQEARAAENAIAALEILTADDEPTGRAEAVRTAWRAAVSGPWSTAARARLAAAWAEQTLDSDDTDVDTIAEAYRCLVDLAARDAVGRYGTGAKQRVMTAAQDYAEEAGYWLARAGHYRDAVVAVENGRAVGLSEILDRSDTTVPDRLRAAGEQALAEEYQAAVDTFEARRNGPAAPLRWAWSHLHDVAGRAAVVLGTDPLSPDVSYDDIVAETHDGAIVYLGSATAGGYALVVAAHHDPQFVDLPKLGRRAVVDLVGKVLPNVEQSTDVARFVHVDRKLRRPRDLEPDLDTTDPFDDALTALWEAGLKWLFLTAARGEVVTLIPVGPLTLLPLHAAGTLGSTFDGPTRFHAGQYSAIRYAPNVRGLRRCREAARSFAGRAPTLLAVDAPNGYGLVQGAHLHYVGRETTEITRRWAGPPAQAVHGCTWEEFRAAADRYTVWHLACHGAAEPASIMDSRLYFVDRPVTLDDLRRLLRPGRRRLAVLSACQTNLTGSTVPNEVVGLPSALLQIGFAGVIATAWAIDDLATTYLMTTFYELWAQRGVEPAVALNRAQLWLRTATRADLQALLPDIAPRGDLGTVPYADPRYWAAFAYTGA